MMVNNYAPHTSSQTFAFANGTENPTNLKYASSTSKPAESAFKAMVLSPHGRPSSKKSKTKEGYGSTMNSTTNLSSNLLSSFQKKKQLTSYLSKAKRNEANRSASFNKRPKSSIVPQPQRSNSGSSKRKKPKDSPKTSVTSQMFGYTTTSATSKFLAGKSLTKFTSVDQLFDGKSSAKPSLKLKSSKLMSKQSKNSSVDCLGHKGYLENDLKYSNKNYPVNLKVKKDKSKIKKKKSKQELGFLNKQLGMQGDGKSHSQEPLSIMNTNHLYASGYPKGTKQTNTNSLSTSEIDKKENFHSIMAFKPKQTAVKGLSKNSSAKEKLFKQEVKTTRPKRPSSKSLIVVAV